MKNEKDNLTDHVTGNIHVYVIPPNLWKHELNTTFTQLFKSTVSAGIVHTNSKLNLIEFRELIQTELGSEFLPKDYLFCKNVGHSLGRIKTTQEHLFQIKEFFPPMSELPEIYVIDRKAVDELSQNVITINIGSPPITPIPLYSIEVERNMKPEESKILQGQLETQNLAQQPYTPNNSNIPSYIETSGLYQPSSAPNIMHIDTTNDTQLGNDQTKSMESTLHRSWSHMVATGDAGLDSISAAIGHQKELLDRLEYEQHKRIMQIKAEAEERRRREAEEYARELAKNSDQAKRLEELENEFRRWNEEAKQARERLDQAKQIWETAMKAKEEEIACLKEGLEIMRNSKSDKDGQPSSAEIAAQTEIRQLQIQLTDMNERYQQVRNELDERRKAADAKVEAVGYEVQNLRRRMSEMNALLKDPKPVEVNITSERKIVRDIGVEAE